MAVGLTPEYARGVELPSILHPYDRHEAVRTILDDPAMVGEDIEVRFNPGKGVEIYNEGSFQSWSATFVPLLGRNALKSAADVLQYIR